MASRRALINGVTGQNGWYLAELLLSQGCEVDGMVRRSPSETFECVAHLRDRIELHREDRLFADATKARESLGCHTKTDFEQQLVGILVEADLERQEQSSGHWRGRGGAR